MRRIFATLLAASEADNDRHAALAKALFCVLVVAISTMAGLVLAAAFAAAPIIGAGLTSWLTATALLSIYGGQR